jgi:hypothetical protein
MVKLQGRVGMGFRGLTGAYPFIRCGCAIKPIRRAKQFSHYNP